MQAAGEELKRYDADFARVCHAHPLLAQALSSRQGFAAGLQHLWRASDFAASLCIDHPALLQDLLEQGHLDAGYNDWQEHLQQVLSRLLPPDPDHPDPLNRLKRGLRLLRKREMLRILWRDIVGNVDLFETCRDLSLFADACIHLALQELTPPLQALHGIPRDNQGREQTLIVLAMGKYGAYELNLSSDIDLIFIYPQDGETQVTDQHHTQHPHARTCTVQQYFSKLGQQLIAVLDSSTSDGFVFRVDMRLRPYGASGALALSIDAMEEYYQTQGRDWERFAMIKARAVTGAAHEVKTLMAMLHAFTYRRYIDFATIDSLRDLKRQIEQQVRRKGMHRNIKLGRGGIREIEFIAQVLQLIYGGRHKHLQLNSLFKALDGLEQERCLPAVDVEKLKACYVLLRCVEHAIQALQDKQTHDLPKDESSLARIAANLGFTSIDALQSELETVRNTVAELFSRVIAEPAADKDESQDRELQQLWLGTLDRDKSLQVLGRHGYDDAEALLQSLETYKSSRQYLALDAASRARMERFMPLLLARAGKDEQPDLAFVSVFTFVQAVARRTAYLVLLLENPLALSQLIMLCTASPWILDLLSRYPVLLDELLRPLDHPPQKDELQDRLRQALLRSNDSEVDEQLITIQNFKQEQILIVAAAELSGNLPLMKVSDSLTWIAEAVLDQVLDMAWQLLVRKYGKPFDAQRESGTRDFIIIGYGKLGGIELNYGSDLDLVFMHDAHPDLETTGGENGIKVNSGAFYVQLGQKVLSLLNTHTVAGRLYEIDLRLRPSGSSGSLVCNPESFLNYQQGHAWTWEHQALIRARVVAGPAGLAARFLAIRDEVLGKQREQKQLAQEIVSMRAKMRKQLGSKPAQGSFHLKQDAGGLIDIEFIVQYLVLAHAHAYRDLLRWSDNMRLLDLIAEHGLLVSDDAHVLQETYIAYRSLLHKRALDNAEYRLTEKEFSKERAAVIRLWDSLFAGIEPGPLHEGSSGATGP
jgi:[glutamine synthetase] adenylyltransferase / [glutamine synthetase]-adenylyl-L-tyrosine phosphorylase